jgi:lactate 2-monooxygenase
MDGIIVSNHGQLDLMTIYIMLTRGFNTGGRQVDGAIPSLYALDKICQSPKIKEAQLSGKFVVMFDSGIRTGSDIIKAVALGAQAVCSKYILRGNPNAFLNSSNPNTVARPYMYGLMISGQAGVEEVILSLLADLDLSLGLSGFKSINEVWRKKEQILTTLDW